MTISDKIKNTFNEPWIWTSLNFPFNISQQKRAKKIKLIICRFIFPMENTFLWGIDFTNYIITNFSDEHSEKDIAQM
jgi:hypothetical protein